MENPPDSAPRVGGGTTSQSSGSATSQYSGGTTGQSTTGQSTTGQSSGGAPSKDDLQGQAHNLKDKAMREGESRVDQQKEQIGRTAKSASSAMRKAADELRNDDDAPEWLATAFSNVAQEVSDLASRMQGKSPGELASETRRFARNNPTAFLAASAAAGFAAARFLRAGADYQHEDHDTGFSSGSGSGSGLGGRMNNSSSSPSGSAFVPQSNYESGSSGSTGVMTPQTGGVR